MASGQGTDATAKDRSALGEAVPIYDDRSKIRGNFLLTLGFVAVGLSGVYMGSGDLAGGNAILGWAYVGGGGVLAAWAVRSVFDAARRLRHPVRLLIGERGFEYSDGPGPISWSEVATIGDPGSPAGRPRILRVQLGDSEGFAERHLLSLSARFTFRANQGDLFLGRDMAMPVVEVESLMRKQLAEFRRFGSAPASTPRRATRPRGRRPARKR